MSSITDVNEEYWSALRAVGLKSRFMELATDLHGVATPSAERAYETARHFVRQANDYYVAAKGASSASSPLLHYYSILNLAKLVLSVCSPTRVETRRQLRHGVRVDGDAAGPLQAKLASEEGVFTSLTELLVSAAPPKSFAVDDVLSRIPDITAEYQEAWRRPDQLARGLCMRRLNDENLQWLHIEIANVYDPQRLTYTGSPLATAYVEVSPSDPSRRAWELHEPVPSTPEGIEHLRTSAAQLRIALSSPDLFEIDGIKVASAIFPYGIGGDAPLPEMSALYAAAFYLSDLVRYHPNVIGDDSTSKDSWVLDTFNRAGLAKFVRLAVNVLTKRDARLTAQ